MDLLSIRTYPDIFLARKAELVTTIDNMLQTLIDDMGYTAYKAQGIGLAATQIGIASRILIYKINNLGKQGTFNAIINPIILEKRGMITSENEGCLSVSDFRADVKRFDKVVVEGIDRNGEEIHVEADGMLSIVLQHEIDHLNGILFIDHLSPLKREIYKKKMHKKQVKARR